MIFDCKEVEYALFAEVVLADQYGLRRLLQRNVTDFVDVGANYGMFAVYAKMLFPAARVFSVEPGAQTFSGLEKNAGLPGVQLFNLALGKKGRVDVHNVGANKHSTTAFCSAGDEVESLPFPELMKRIGCTVSSRTFVKFDCEGAEAVLLCDEAAEVLKPSLGFALEAHRGGTVPDTLPPMQAYEDWLLYHFSASHALEKIPVRNGTADGETTIFRATRP